MNNELELLEAAYLSLLKMPRGAMRVRLQTALCILRDEIAGAAGLTSEAVQDEFEYRAASI